MKFFLPGPLSALISIALGGVLLGLLLLRQQQPQLDFYHPLGYVRKVRTLVDNQLLRYDSKSRKIVFKRDQASPELIEFYEKSYLKQDVANFNGGDRLGTFYLDQRSTRGGPPEKAH